MTMSAVRPLSMGLLVATCALVSAQSLQGLVTPTEADRYGLERMWYAQVHLDAARGQLNHLTQHVSSSESITVYEVVYNGLKTVYRETDLDLFGEMLGKERAQKRAEVRLNELKNQQVDAKLVTVQIPRVTLYAVTSSAVLQAIDGETGRTRWKASVGNPRFPTVSAGANDQYVATLNASDLYVLNAATGEIVWQRKVTNSPGAGPAVSESMVFVPMVNGAMSAYALDNPKAYPTNFQSHGHAMIQPIYTGSYVAWPTDRGHLYVTGGRQNRINFRLETKGSIEAAASFMPPSKIVATSIDGFVYCVEQSSGVLLWRFSSGEPIVTTPTVYGDAVYTTTTDGTLFALDAQMGQEIWSRTQMRQVVSGSASRLYCLDELDRLAILDRKTGSQLGAISAQAVELPLVNKQTDRLILATRSGLIQCVRERSQEYPLMHLPTQKVDDATPKRPVRRSEAETPETPAAGAVDPFTGQPLQPGGAAEGNPFGPAAAEPSSTPAAPKDASDPFGASPF